MLRLIYRYLFFLLILFIPKSIVAQDQEATLIFTDGTSLTGFASIKWDENPFSVPSKDVILFKLTKEDNADEWDGTMIDKVIFYGFEYNRTFQFVNIPFNKKPEYHLLELLEEGEVNLYIEAQAIVNFNPIPNNFMYQTEYVAKMRVKRSSEDKFTTFGGSKKKIAAYFNNCSGIVSKLKSNEFNIGTIREIVSYYNDYVSDTKMKQK
jgi:hypothetical protein